MGKRNKFSKINSVISLALVCVFPRQNETDLNLWEYHPHLLLSLCQTPPGWLCPPTLRSVTLTSLACRSPGLHNVPKSSDSPCWIRGNSEGPEWLWLKEL